MTCGLLKLSVFESGGTPAGAVTSHLFPPNSKKGGDIHSLSQCLNISVLN